MIIVLNLFFFFVVVYHAVLRLFNIEHYLFGSSFQSGAGLVLYINKMFIRFLSMAQLKFKKQVFKKAKYLKGYHCCDVMMGVYVFRNGICSLQM